MRRSIVAHPFLFVLFQVLFLYNHNIGELSIGVVYMPLAVILILAFLSWTLASVVLGDRYKAGLVVSLFLGLFFSFGHVYNKVMGGPFVHLLYFLWPVLFLAGSYFSVRAKRSPKNLTSVLNAVAVVLVAISLVNVVTFELKDRARVSQAAGPSADGAVDWERPRDLPNIFFIVLDGYGRADVFKEIYGHDNSGFLDYLTGKGFYVAERSVANYSQTGLAFASILNFKYLDEFAREIGVDSTSRRPMNTAVKNSRLFGFLRDRGYRIIAFSSGRPETEIDNADLYISPGQSPNTFQNELINITPIPLIMSAISTPKTRDKFDLHRDRLLFVMDNLVKMTEQKPPVFVFAHIESPHPPFVFGQDGEEVSYEKRFNDHDADWLIRRGRLTSSQYRKAYIDQVVFLNKRMKTIIDALLSRSKIPPVIVLMGDHGPRSMLVWENPEETYFRESMTNLSAFYLPGGGEEDLYEGISPVNTFRVILNRYFGTDYELLEDRSFFSKAKYLYRFIDVTEKVRNPDPAMMHYKFANAFLAENRPGEAVDHYQEALALGPGSAKIHSNLGVAFAELGDYGSAYLHFSEALRLDPDLDMVRENMEMISKLLKRGG
jgi:hypothetical protein